MQAGKKVAHAEASTPSALARVPKVSLGVLLTGALAAVWTAPPVVVGAAVMMGIAVITIATLRREVTWVE
jgi:hypothetical protein